MLMSKSAVKASSSQIGSYVVIVITFKYCKIKKIHFSSVNGKQSSTSRSGSRPSSSPPLRQRSSLSRQSPRPSSTSPLQSYSDFRQVADNSGR